MITARDLTPGARFVNRSPVHPEPADGVHTARAVTVEEVDSGEEWRRIVTDEWGPGVPLIVPAEHEFAEPGDE
jgi:hypothetical protein